MGGSVLGSNSTSIQGNNNRYFETHNEWNGKGFEFRNDFRNRFVNNVRSNDRNSLRFRSRPKPRHRSVFGQRHNAVHKSGHIETYHERHSKRNDEGFDRRPNERQGHESEAGSGKLEAGDLSHVGSPEPEGKSQGTEQESAGDVRSVCAICVVCGIR